MIPTPAQLLSSSPVTAGKPAPWHALKHSRNSLDFSQLLGDAAGKLPAGQANGSLLPEALPASAQPETVQFAATRPGKLDGKPENESGKILPVSGDASTTTEETVSADSDTNIDTDNENNEAPVGVVSTGVPIAPVIMLPPQLLPPSGADLSVATPAAARSSQSVPMAKSSAPSGLDKGPWVSTPFSNVRAHASRSSQLTSTALSQDNTGPMGSVPNQAIEQSIRLAPGQRVIANPQVRNGPADTLLPTSLLAQAQAAMPREVAVATPAANGVSSVAASAVPDTAAMLQNVAVKPPADVLAAHEEGENIASVDGGSLRQPVADHTPRAPEIATARATDSDPDTKAGPAANTGEAPAPQLAHQNLHHLGIGSAATTGSPDAAASQAAQGAGSSQQSEDFNTIVARLNEARNDASPDTVRTSLNHAQFGQVSLQMRQHDGGLSVTMASADPSFAPAVQAAVVSSQAADSAARDGAQQQQAGAHGQSHNPGARSDMTSGAPEGGGNGGGASGASTGQGRDPSHGAAPQRTRNLGPHSPSPSSSRSDAGPTGRAASRPGGIYA